MIFDLLIAIIIASSLSFLSNFIDERHLTVFQIIIITLLILLCLTSFAIVNKL